MRSRVVLLLGYNRKHATPSIDRGPQWSFSGVLRHVLRRRIPENRKETARSAHNYKTADEMRGSCIVHRRRGKCVNHWAGLYFDTKPMGQLLGQALGM